MNRFNDWHLDKMIWLKPDQKLVNDDPEGDPNKFPKYPPKTAKGKVKMKNTRIKAHDVIIMTEKGKNKTKRGASAIRYTGYRDGMSIAEAKEAGLVGEDFRYDREHGHIIIKTPDEMNEIVRRYVDRALAEAKRTNDSDDNTVWIVDEEDGGA